jgi:hypothetical protein
MAEQGRCLWRCKILSPDLTKMFHVNFFILILNFGNRILNAGEGPLNHGKRIVWLERRG